MTEHDAKWTSYPYPGLEPKTVVLSPHQQATWQLNNTNYTDNIASRYTKFKFEESRRRGINMLRKRKFWIKA